MTARWKRWMYLTCLCLIPFSGNAATPQISAGAGFAVLDANGVIWTAGGAIGNYSSQPAKLQSVADVKSVSLGGSTSWIIRADNSLWGTGSNQYGELGTGSPGSTFTSQPVRILDNVTHAVEQGSSTYAIRIDGSLWAWGRNEQGQLGLGDRANRSTPTPVPGLSNVVQIAAGGGSHAVALTADGKVWAMGFNNSGALGWDVLGLLPDDPRIYQTTPQLIAGIDSVVTIAAANSTTFMVRADGTLWVLGDNFAGQLGLGEVANHVTTPRQVQSLNGVVAAATNGGFSLALLQDGSVWGWGANLNGQLGGLGRANESAPIKLTFLSDVTAIALGGGATSGTGFALRPDGTIVSWGGNFDGSLGRGSIDAVLPPGMMAGPGGAGTFNAYAAAPTTINQPPSISLRVAASGDQAPVTATATVGAADSDGTVASIRLLATDGQSASISSTSGTATFQFTSAGTYRVDAIAVDNRGGATVIRGGGGSEIIVKPPVIAISTKARILAGVASPIVLNSRGEIRTWGVSALAGDSVAQLYAPNPTPNGLPHAFNPRINTVVGIAATGSGKFAVLQSGQVLAWGDNTQGALGLASGTPTYMATLVPDLSGIVQVAGGSFHSLALDSRGRVYTTGANDYGQLGLGDRVARSGFTPLQAPTDIVQISAGAWISYALDSGGQVWVWGRNSSEQVGSTTTADLLSPQVVPGLPPIATIFGAGFGAFAIARDGTVWGWSGILLPDASGSTPRLQPSLSGATRISGDGAVAAMLKADGTVWTWGGGDTIPLLGDGAMGNRSRPAIVPGLTNIIDISMGVQNALALRSDGTVLSWGQNASGQLGDGTLVTRLTPVLVVNETINGPLDLISDVPNSIPPYLIPPFFLATYANGALNSTTLYADLRGLIPSGTFASAGDDGRFAAGYNVYVAANVPAIPASPYFQLNANGSWATLSWPMAEFMRSVALDSQTSLVRAQILQNVDMSSPALTGTSIIVGYGTDPDEMLRTARYRTIFTVPQP